MKRRNLLSLLSAATVASVIWPLDAPAQQKGPPVIGFLNGGTAQGYAPMVAAFRQGLNESGFVEGRDVTIEYRWAEDDVKRLPALLDDLVRKRVNAIAATSTPAILAAKAGGTTIPVIFAIGADPVKLGLVSSLSRPGGNITGALHLNEEIVPKRLELLRELVPGSNQMAFLMNPVSNPSTESQAKLIQVVASTLGLKLRIFHAGSESELEKAFAEMARLQVGGLVIGCCDPFYTTRGERFAALSVQHAIPTVFQYRDFVAAGGLASYGGSITDTYRLAGIYTGRILKGEKPADLPVQQGTKVELLLNMRTAKALGVTVPLPLLGRADEVIE